MDLIEIHPQFNLYNFRWPIRTGATHDPPAKFVFRDEAQARVGIATDSMVSHGCIISGGRIHRSVLGVGCRVNSFSEVEESVLFERVRVGPSREDPSRDHRQGRRDPPGHGHRVRPRGRQAALLRHRAGDRRHPQACETRWPGLTSDSRGEPSWSATFTAAATSSKLC
jgi:NDP-sugar pyrophosphorylase family protein